MEHYKSTCASTKFTNIPGTIFDLYNKSNNTEESDQVIGGIISDTKLSWLALGPYLQVFYTSTGEVRSVWCFGAVAKELNAKVVCVQELKMPFRNVHFLAVGLKYGSQGGMICIYNLSCAKVLRAIEMPEEVTSIHVISTGNSTTTYPGPLSTLDGILAVGTASGSIYIVDLRMERIAESRRIDNILDIRNESQPCPLKIISPTADARDLEQYKMLAEGEDAHLAILLNQNKGQHFELKTPQGRNLILAAKEEVTVSTLQYAPQLCSLFVGYNFGALQLWNLLFMSLEYTSPVYEEKIPVSFIAVQEPIDDPRAFCYFWAVYSCSDSFNNIFPLAALYSLSYDSKEYHEGHGYIYERLHSCAVRFQTNLQNIERSTCRTAQGANCIHLQTFGKAVHHTNSTVSLSSNDDSYSLCSMVWNVQCEEHNNHTYMSIFDLNQWYKEQMPSLPHHDVDKNYMTHLELESKGSTVLDAAMDPVSIDPYIAVQKLEEHYRPSSLAYNLITLNESTITHQAILGAQRFFFRELEEVGPLALMHPEDLYTAARTLGLQPLFTEMPIEPPLQQQCELLLSIALERRLLKWLCHCALSWGNGSHRSSGLSLEMLLMWGWERTRVLKKNADSSCTSLFDYSSTRLDDNAHTLITACRVQFGHLKDLFKFIMKNCDTFLIHPDVTRQQLTWLQKNYAYFNVIGWMINLKLLPETNESYPIDNLRKYYSERRNYLRSLPNDQESDVNEVLFIDAMTNHEALRADWLEDGYGVYPPATLQTLLRAYLLDWDIETTHSLMAYVLLDLVQNQSDSIERNATISTTMVKFPQIFDLSLSKTKAIQSFWQFDRGNVEQAVSILASRVVHPHDVLPWQRRFILSSLKRKGQYRLALSYMKARTSKSDDDVRNLIQLYVRNNMLFEALSVQRRHADDSLLGVFFLECMRADVIMKLTGFNFTCEEEHALIAFMNKHEYPLREEFKANYFVRRGRYLDFYMRYDKEVNDRHSMPTLIKNSLDSILPHGTKKLIDTCIRLKDYTYNDTKSLAVYVCDRNERAKFGNDFVKAAVVNCKKSWSGQAEIADDFPFMRPIVKRPRAIANRLVYPRRVLKIPTRETQEEREETTEPPSKRLRMSPTLADDLNMTNIETMHYQRSNVSQSVMNVTTTPHSILKTTSMHSYRGESSTPENLDEMRRSLTPLITREPSVRTTPMVRFSGVTSGSSSANTSYDPMASVFFAKEASGTSTDYCSAETSPMQQDSNKRKRKLSVWQDNTEVLAARSNNDVSTIYAEKFLESMRNTNVVEEVIPEMSIPKVIPVEITSRSSDVFIFTGNDSIPEVDHGLSPKSRPSYQLSLTTNDTTLIPHSPSPVKVKSKRQPVKSLSQRVLQAGVRKLLHESEVSVENKIIKKTITKDAADEITQIEESDFRKTLKVILQEEPEEIHVDENMEVDKETPNFGYNVDVSTNLDENEEVSYCEQSVPQQEMYQQHTENCRSDNRIIVDNECINEDRNVIQAPATDNQKTTIDITETLDTTGEKYYADADFDITEEEEEDYPERKEKFMESFELISRERRESMQSHKDESFEEVTDVSGPHLLPPAATTFTACDSYHILNKDDSRSETKTPEEVIDLMVSSSSEESDDERLETPKVTSATLIEIKDTPVARLSMFNRTGFVDYFTDVDTPHESLEASKIDGDADDASEISSVYASPLKMNSDESLVNSRVRRGSSEVRVTEELATPKAISRTIIEIKDTPVASLTMFNRTSFVDYFSDVDTPNQSMLPETSRPDCNAVDASGSSSVYASPDKINIEEVSKPILLKRIAEEPCDINKTSGMCVTEELTTPEVTSTTIEIKDTPVARMSMFDRARFIDYFSDVDTPNQSMASEPKDPATTKCAANNSNISDKVQNNKAESTKGDEMDLEQYASKEEIDIYADLSNPHYSIDPVMSSYNDDPSLGVPDPDLTLNAHPPEELLKTPIDDGTDVLNTAGVAYSVASSSSRSTGTSTSNTSTSNSGSSSTSKSDAGSAELLPAADVAFIHESQSDTSSQTGSSNEEFAKDRNQTKDCKVDETKPINKKEDSTSAAPQATPRILNTISEEESFLPISPVRRRRSTSIQSDVPVASPVRSLRSRPESPALTIQLRPRRSSNSSDKVTPLPKAKPVARTRSNSVDTPLPSNRNLRARSVDPIEQPVAQPAVGMPKKRGRKSLVLPAIEEEQKPKPAKRTNKRSVSDSEHDLMQSRRLTRSQKVAMSNASHLGVLDLMNKEDFTGAADPEEVSLLQRSPPSSIASSSAAENARRNLRGGSVDNLTIVDEADAKPHRSRGRPRKIALNRSSADSSIGVDDSGVRTRSSMCLDMNVIAEEAESTSRTSTVRSVAKRGRPRSGAK